MTISSIIRLGIELLMAISTVDSRLYPVMRVAFFSGEIPPALPV